MATHLRRIRVPLIVAGIAVLATACAVDLGTLGGQTSTAAGINDGGIIVGTSENIYGQTHAFKLTPGEITRDLGALNSGRSEAKAVNASGVVVGTSGFRNADGSIVDHAVRWNADSSLTDLGTVVGASAVATDINDAGDIVGTLTFNDLDTRAFVWTFANPTLSTLPGIGTPYSAAVAINNHREIVGTAIVNGVPNVQGILWSPAATTGSAGCCSTGSFLTGQPLTQTSYIATDLGAGTGVTAASDINDAGTIVGQWSPALGDDVNTKAVQWSGSAHAMTELPIPFLPKSINAGGTIVGTGRYSVIILGVDHVGHKAYRYSPGTGVTDLGTLGGADASVASINTGGVAVGSAQKPDDTVHAARFDPASAGASHPARTQDAGPRGPCGQDEDAAGGDPGRRTHANVAC